MTDREQPDVLVGEGGPVEQPPVEDLMEHCVARFEALVRSVFRERREFFANEIASALSAALAAGAAPARQDEWIRIESLSQLRTMVGGRFQNLRARWMAAGFPLREHRGDKSGASRLDEHGWVELSNWMLKQGYEARPAPEGAEYLFEVRSAIK